MLQVNIQARTVNPFFLAHFDVGAILLTTESGSQTESHNVKREAKCIQAARDTVNRSVEREFQEEMCHTFTFTNK